MNLIKVALSHYCCKTILQEMILKTGKFSVPAEMRRSTKQPGLAAAESSKPELRPPEKRDRRSLVRHVDGTNRDIDSVERSCRPEEQLRCWKDTFAQVYCGAVPLRQRYVSTHSRNWIRDS